jgi:hypothetical protein
MDIDIVALDTEGNEIVARTNAAFASTREDEALTIRSAEGALELVLPPSALSAPFQLVVETAVARLPTPPPDYELLGDVYRVESSQGDRLAVPGLLAMELDVSPNGLLRTGREPHRPAILRLVEEGDRYEIIERQEFDERYVGAQIDRLGTFALVDQVESGG